MDQSHCHQLAQFVKNAILKSDEATYPIAEVNWKNFKALIEVHQIEICYASSFVNAISLKFYFSNVFGSQKIIKTFSIDKQQRPIQ